MLAGSGHIAGVVNHPAKKKYHHSINDALPASLDDWKAGPKRSAGSWWPYWIEWLEQRFARQGSGAHPGRRRSRVIEDAPGSYVKVKA